DLRAAAGLSVLAPGPTEREMRKAVGRLLHVDDDARIDAYRDILRYKTPPPTHESSGVKTRYLRMLVASLVGTTVDAKASLSDACQVVWQHPQIIAELQEMLTLLPPRIQHLGASIPQYPTLPLRVHARYTRIEIQAAFGDGQAARVPVWREG